MLEKAEEKHNNENSSSPDVETMRRVRIERLRSSTPTVFGSLQMNMIPDFRIQVYNIIIFQILHVRGR
ncbi:hypothetical protein J6590_024246 [Homalodisca vitripennis]|nr:hypothetical protein J6590_024246 [Homalodisca vitripennis]